MKGHLINSSLVVVLALATSQGESSGQQTPPSSPVQEKEKKEADFLHIDQSPKDIWIDLAGKLPPGAARRILVRVATSGKPWLLPVYILKDLEVPPHPGPGAPVVLTLYDALYHPQWSAAIQNAMDTMLAKDAWEAGKPINNEVHVTLWVDVNGRPVEVAGASFTRYSGRPEVTIKLTPDPSAAAVLAGADRKDIGLTFAETYRGRFATVDLEAIMTCSSDTAVAFQNMLKTDAKNQRATLLVAFGGGVDQKLAVQQMFRRQVTLAVLTREGKEVNPALLESVIKNLFAGLEQEIKLKELKDDAVVTFVFANGLKATASIGTFKRMSKQWKTERESLLEQAESKEDANRTRLGGETNGSFYEVFSGGLKLDYESDTKTASSSSRKEQVRALDEVMKHIEGDLPVAALDAGQLQTLASKARTALKFSLGSFSEGRKTLYYPLSLQAAFGPKARAKTEAEIRAEASAAKKNEVEQENQRLAAAIKARDQIVVENQPHELQLTGLQQRVAEAKAQRSMAEAALAKPLKEIEEYLHRYPWLFSPDQSRAAFENSLGVHALRAALADKQRVVADWEKALADHEKNLSPMRATLATAEQTIRESAARLAKLKAELAALGALISASQP